MSGGTLKSMRTFKRVLSYTIILLIISLSIGAVVQRQAINDWWILRSYDPPVAVVNLADSITTTDYGQKLFYVNKPQIDGAEAFRNSCTISEASIILGCYVENDGIYIFDVTDVRLAGVQQVTAAHELLHVAYQRLNGAEKERINNLTSIVRQNLTDERILQTIETYQTRDSAVVPNELHSIFATELRDLPKELEDYYAQYFTDRLRIVAYSEHYEEEFTSRRQRVVSLDAQLNDLRIAIDSGKSQLSVSEATLSSQQKQLDVYLNSNQIGRYNSLVPVYNNTVNSYNLLVASTVADIDRFNALVEERNTIATETNELFEAIDSRPTTIKTQ